MNADERASILPAGTVTFLVSDAHRSDVVAALVAAHNGLRADAHGPPAADGMVVAVFGSAADAAAAALDIQRHLLAEPGPDHAERQARTGLHTGEALLRDERYYTGAALTRCVRLRDIAHEGETVLSSATATPTSAHWRAPWSATWGRTGCGTCPTRNGSSSCGPPASTATSRRCGRWTRWPTTCRSS
jgi:class 3 adenylate cyclase